MMSATQELQESPEIDSDHRKTHVSKEKHRKRMIQAYQEEIQTLSFMKQNEKEEGISNGRRKWFNSQIEDLREKISQVKGDSSE